MSRILIGTEIFIQQRDYGLAAYEVYSGGEMRRIGGFPTWKDMINYLKRMKVLEPYEFWGDLYLKEVEN